MDSIDLEDQQEKLYYNREGSVRTAFQDIKACSDQELFPEIKAKKKEEKAKTKKKKRKCVVF